MSGLHYCIISRAKNFNGVFTAVRDSSGELKVIPWRLSTDGHTITRGTSASAGAIASHVDVAPLGQGVAAAVSDSEGKLRLITWSSSPDGDIESRRATATAGAATDITLLTAPHGGSNLTTVVRGSDGDLHVVGWAVADNGRNLRRLGSSKAGAATQISADMAPGDAPRDRLVTALKDGSGNLKLITWDTNLANP